MLTVPTVVFRQESLDAEQVTGYPSSRSAYSLAFTGSIDRYSA